MLIPNWVISLPWDLIQEAAKEFSLDPKLVGAIMQVESNGNHYVTRLEPQWKYFSNPRIHAENLGITEQSESMHQATSWGALQIMGAVTRELGYQGPLTRLAEPRIGMHWACRKLQELTRRYGEESQVIASWNGGSPRKTPGGMYLNQSYVDKVSRNLAELRKLLG